MDALYKARIVCLVEHIAARRGISFEQAFRDFRQEVWKLADALRAARTVWVDDEPPSQRVA